MISQIGYWIVVMLGFGFLIFVHELGHFVAAKCVGIRVIRFAVGFGPRLFGMQIGQTDYCICLVPCGGYVKMAGGEGEGDEEMTGAPDEFPSKTPGQRAFVVLAGPAMSILAAVPLLFGVLSSGYERPSSRINQIVPGMPAWDAGLKRGDLITGLKLQDEESWKPIRLWRQVKLNAALQEKVGDIDVRVERNGKEKVFSLTTDKKGHIGVSWKIVGRGEGYLTTRAGHRPKGGAADQAGIVPGSRIIELAGRRIHTWEDVSLAAAKHPGEEVTVKFIPPGGQEKTAKLKIGTDKYWSLGIIARRPNRVRLVRPGFPAEAAGLQPGDVIVAVDGRRVSSWPEIERLVADAGPRTIALTFRRSPRGAGAPAANVGQGERTVEVLLEEGDEAGDMLGIDADQHPVVEGFLPNSDAKEVGIPVGVKLLTAGTPESGREPTQLKQFRQSVELVPWKFVEGGKLAVTCALGDDKRMIVPVTLIEREFGVLELSPRLDMCYLVEPGRPMAALGQAFVETAEWVGFAAKGIWMLFTGRLSMDMLSGPVMILTITRYQAEAGFIKFIEFLVIITVHLGIINLVPFPILDGGHVLFLIIEKIRGKPLPEKAMAWLMYAGMTLIIGLMVLVTWNDIAKLVDLFGG